ncbi:MAG: hypothetical protein KAW93_07815 [Methanogenium sp.]|nr:hypothetical protein [Methanogenium sp.]
MKYYGVDERITVVVSNKFEMCVLVTDDAYATYSLTEDETVAQVHLHYRNAYRGDISY